jgi:hypothetical protein
MPAADGANGILYVLHRMQHIPTPLAHADHVKAHKRKSFVARTFDDTLNNQENECAAMLALSYGLWHAEEAEELLTTSTR